MCYLYVHVRAIPTYSVYQLYDIYGTTIMRNLCIVWLYADIVQNTFLHNLMPSVTLSMYVYSNLAN